MPLSDDELAKRLDASIKRTAELRAQNPGSATQPPAAAPRGRSCPICGTQMKSGTVSVHGTAWMFLVVGLSHQNCYFADADGKEEVIVPSGHTQAGMRCPECGFVGIPNRGESRRLANPFGQV